MKMTGLAMLLACLSTLACHAAQPPSLLPLPAEVKWSDGSLPIHPGTTISAGEGALEEARLLQTELAALTGLKLAGGKSTTGAIVLRIDTTASQNPEGYRLVVSKAGARIAAPTSAGLFYGTRTFLQLVEKTSKGWTARCADITDAPRFGWRGLMLDEARHFMGKDYLIHLLDTMAAHKMNRLHWHLTDDQGWRIEIKAYPKLTSVGAWRGEGTKMPMAKWDKDREGHPGNARYGGFHTQADIREIVAHAKKLHIQIIPEIDVPGHASAITTAYPETLPISDGDAGKGVHGLRGNVISVVREENYTMLETIFGEIADLFPAPYIHVGGDEVNVNAWKASPEHRAFMKEHGMKNAHQLQNHFMLRLEKILAGMGRTLVGWNEIMHGGHLSKDTVIMSWIGIGPGVNAARKGHPVVMCPGPHCYFDMKYPGPDETGHWWAGIVSTQRAYDWNPTITDQLNETEQARIKGVQCCLWTEFVPNTDGADYKLWPRACATAEVGWTPQERREWSDFEQRLGNHLDRLDRLSVNYHVMPSSALLDKGIVTLSAPGSGFRVVYTTDGTDPTATSPVYGGKPLTLDDPASLKHRALRTNGRMSRVITGIERLPVANWSPKVVSTELKTVRFELENAIDASGTWYLGFHYKRGAHKIVIEDVGLLQNGKEIARDTHTGHAGGQHTDNIYRLVIPKHNAGDRYVIEAKLRSDGGNSSYGILSLEQSSYQEPVATAETTMTTHAGNTPGKACDWNRSNFFWSSRGGRKGDTFTIGFAEPVSCKQISVQTGKADSNQDIILDGSLALSADGTTFGEPVALVMGSGTVKKPAGMTVKALRLTIGSDQNSWVIVRDPKIK